MEKEGHRPVGQQLERVNSWLNRIEQDRAQGSIPIYAISDTDKKLSTVVVTPQFERGMRRIKFSLEGDLKNAGKAR